MMRPAARLVPLLALLAPASLAAQGATSPLDRSGSASDLGYASKTIFERRLSRLVSSFAALWCPQRDERRRSVAGTKASRAKSWAVAQSPRSAACSAIQPDRT